MKAWFESLEARERLMVAAGAILATLIIVWGFVWSPLHGGVAELRDSTAQKRALLIDLQRAAALTSAGGATPSANPGQSLVLLVDQTAQAMGVRGSFTRTRPDGSDAISVSFTNAPFDNLVEWLVMLERGNAIAVESASFNSAREQGLVNGQLSLRRL